MDQAPETPEPDRSEIDALVALYGQGQLEALLARGEPLSARHPRSAALHNILGAAHAALRRHDAALVHYDQAIALNPDFASAHNNRSNALKEIGRLDDAIAGYQRALGIKPDYANAHNNLGNVLLDAGRGDEAVASYARAVAIQPGYADAHYNMGNALRQLGRPDEAALAFERALGIKPDHADAHNNLGNALKELGRREEAVASFRRALAIRPEYADAHFNLGQALRELERNDEAVACFTRAVAIRPDHADAHVNLGVAQLQLGRKDLAIACFEQALRLRPGDTAVRAQKLHQQAHICDWDAIGAEADWIPRLGVAGESISPFTMLAFEDAPDRHRLRSEISVRESVGQPDVAPVERRAGIAEPLRIGYFSADFHDHATMYLMARLFELHDRSRFEIHAYSHGPDKDDAMRRRLKSSVDAFHDVRAMSDGEIARLARRHGLDIAIDLKGHTGQNRMGIFARRPAPIQIGYLGYPGTSGAPFIDYLIADRVLIPDEQRRHYSESVIYLPGSYQVNDDSRPIAAGAITRTEAGLPEDAFVFACFNNSYKIAPTEFDIWMRLLHRVENSVLWLLKGNPWTEANLRKEARKRGIDPGRLVFAEPVFHAEHLARHALADLFLDTFNCNAHTTASDALWAGLPVLTRAGESFAARVAASLLHAAGLPELVTTTAQDYERLAFALATDAENLSALRSKLAANRLSCPLFDTEAFVRGIEQAYEQAWRVGLAGTPTADIAIID